MCLGKEHGITKTCTRVLDPERKGKMKTSTVKHYSFEAMTPWRSKDGKEEKVIVWYRYGGKIRGKLSFQFFDDEKTAKAFAVSLK